MTCTLRVATKSLENFIPFHVRNVVRTKQSDPALRGSVGWLGKVGCKLSEWSGGCASKEEEYPGTNKASGNQGLI